MLMMEAKLGERYRDDGNIIATLKRPIIHSIIMGGDSSKFLTLGIQRAPEASGLMFLLLMIPMIPMISCYKVPFQEVFLTTERVHFDLKWYIVV